MADILNAHPGAWATVDGHTDGGDGGPEHSALALSQARAESVRDWLIAHGVPAARIQVRGWGSTQPLQPSDSPAHRAANRRCDVSVTDTPH
ncbi:OmpA family protein [Mycobacterium sp. BMJ-28]